MHRTSLTGQLVTFVVVVVASAYALRWAYDLLRPLLPLFVVLAVAFGLWRLSSFFRARRW